MNIKARLTPKPMSTRVLELIDNRSTKIKKYAWGPQHINPLSYVTWLG